MSGQCKVALRRVVEQPVPRHVHTKFCVDEPNDLFRQFDPDASLLDGFKDKNTLKQNSIYYITEN